MHSITDEIVFDFISDWIVDIGPQTSYDDAKCAPCYEYSVVSDEFGLSLFVLARNPADFVNNYNSTVYEFLLEHGKHCGLMPVMGALTHAVLFLQGSHTTTTSPSRHTRTRPASTLLFLSINAAVPCLCLSSVTALFARTSTQHNSPYIKPSRIDLTTRGAFLSPISAQAWYPSLLPLRQNVRKSNASEMCSKRAVR
jgi:hypothetical protein